MVCHLLLFGGPSPEAGVCGDCLVVGGLRCWKTFVFDLFLPRCMDDMGLCCRVFG